MKVLGIVCSPRKNGNTEIMMSRALMGAQSYGAETELWTTAGKELTSCDACGTCIKREGKCRIKDDIQELYPKVLEADGLIFGSPVYFVSVTAQAKIVIDRLYCLYNHYVLASKVAGILSVSGGSGAEGVRTVFREFIQMSHMFPADDAFGFARGKGEITKDKYAMKSAEELGKQVASLIMQQLRFPEEYRMPLYRICRERYGVDYFPILRSGK